MRNNLKNILQIIKNSGSFSQNFRSLIFSATGISGAEATLFILLISSLFPGYLLTAGNFFVLSCLLTKLSSTFILPFAKIGDKRLFESIAGNKLIMMNDELKMKNCELNNHIATATLLSGCKIVKACVLLSAANCHPEERRISYISNRCFTIVQHNKVCKKPGFNNRVFCGGARGGCETCITLFKTLQI